MKSPKILIALMLMSVLSCKDDSDYTMTFDGTIETFAGSTFGFDGEGISANWARLGYITSLAIDANGNIYVSDGASNTIRRINTANTINRVAGTFIGFNVADPTPYAGDGGPGRSAHLNVPLAVAVDAHGNVYISDTGNNVIRKVDANGKISTVIGKGPQGSSGDNGPASDALIYSPMGIAFNASGDLYFADSQNHTIRKVTTDGQITTIAGTPGQSGYSGDGGDATFAKLDTPIGIAIDPKDNIYFSDNNNVVRCISAFGKITTIAGTDANLASPKAVALDTYGNILVADSGNNKIKRISLHTGIVDTIAGTGEANHTGDLGFAVNATLSNPQGIAVASNGDIYVAESGNGIIRLIKPAN